jgi:hypothetical protein
MYIEEAPCANRLGRGDNRGCDWQVIGTIELADPALAGALQRIGRQKR